MSNKPYKGFEPKWLLTPAPADSYRSIFRWGDPNFFKYPKESLYTLMKETFKMTDDDFKAYSDDIGFDPVDLSDHPVQLAPEHIEALKKIVGEQNVSTTDYDRLSVAYGFTAYDILRLRHKRVDSVPDVVLYPETTGQVEQIVAYSTEHHIPLYVYGGGSSVTRGVEPVKGGISLDMRRNFNKVISFNEIDQTITVQAGMSGPDLEKTLQSAPELFGAKRQYTCGHFPQSFEYSSVGGWTVTRGAGQNSTYYGTIADIVLSQKYATPIGTIQTSHYSREATGPNLNQIMMGSEGTFGVLTEVTLRIFRWMPQNRKRFSYIFKTWDAAMKAAREMMQCECGYSSVFRLSDPEETNLMLKLYNVGLQPQCRTQHRQDRAPSRRHAADRLRHPQLGKGPLQRPLPARHAHGLRHHDRHARVHGQLVEHGAGARRRAQDLPRAAEHRRHHAHVALLSAGREPVFHLPHPHAG